MAKIGNSYQGKMENRARAVAREVRVSPKRACEVAKAIKGMELGKAKAVLERSIGREVAIPFTRFNRGVAHRTGIGPGAYADSTCREMLNVLNEVEANAEARGLTGELMINHIATQRARVVQGRFKGGAHNTHTTHIEIVVEEKPGEKKEKIEEKPKEEKKEAKKEEKKKEVSEPAKEDKKKQSKAGSD